MPYDIQKSGKRFLLVNSRTGKVKSRHDSRKKAIGSAYHATKGEGRKFTALIKRD